MKRLVIAIAATIILPLTVFLPVDGQAEEITPETSGAFIILEKAPELQKFGIDSFCNSAGQTVCERLDYDDYANMKGRIVGEEPAEEDWTYEWWEVLLENGERFYLQLYKPKGRPPIEVSREIISLAQYKSGNSRVGEPIIEGSPATIARFEGDFSRYYFSFAEEGLGEEGLRVAQRMLKSSSDRSRDKEIVKILTELTVKHDKFEDLTILSPAPYRFRDLDGRPAIELRLVLSDGEPRILERVMYSGDDWLFVGRYTILAGDKRYESPSHEFNRDHSGGSVWEWVTVDVDQEQRQLLTAILDDDEAAIRFHGKQYYKDHEFTEAEKSAISDILTLEEFL